MPRVITLDELRARLEGDDPVTLVEALPPMYYEAEHLPGAINVPHDEVDALAPALLPDRDAAIVVYCASGPCQNSGIAAVTLPRSVLSATTGLARIPFSTRSAAWTR